MGSDKAELMGWDCEIFEDRLLSDSLLSPENPAQAIAQALAIKVFSECLVTELCLLH